MPQLGTILIQACAQLIGAAVVAKRIFKFIPIFIKFK